jgi:hypothetical protein
MRDGRRSIACLLQYFGGNGVGRYPVFGRQWQAEGIFNVDTDFELVDPGNHDLVLEFKKVTGEARFKLLVRDLTCTWEQVKATLEENYATHITIDYCACKKFSSRQDKNEKISRWRSRVRQL